MQDLKITLIQSTLHWESTDANLAMFEEKIWQIKEKTDIITLPEMFTTGFSMDANQSSSNGQRYYTRWRKVL